MNRILNPMQAIDKQVVEVFGDVMIGATGAVGTLKGAGVTSVTRTGTGAYTIALDDTFYKFLMFQHKFLFSTSSLVAQVDVVSTTTSTVLIACWDYAGNAIDPANGAQMFFCIKARRSSVGV